MSSPIWGIMLRMNSKEDSKPCWLIRVCVHAGVLGRGLGPFMENPSAGFPSDLILTPRLSGFWKDLMAPKAEGKWAYLGIVGRHAQAWLGFIGRQQHPP